MLVSLTSALWGHYSIRVGLDKADAEGRIYAPITVSRSNALRRAKSKVLKAWKRDWANTEKTGGFAPANRIPPSLKFPTPILQHIQKFQRPRELFGRIIQCRTNHGYTGSFRHRFKLQGDISCPCGEAAIQTREHILCECPRYTEARSKLREASKYIFLPDILGTIPGIKALASFLASSGAYTRNGTQPTPPKPPSFDEEPVPDSEDDDSDLDL